MLHLPSCIRTAIAWALMPAAFWSGVQAPECECASGEHRFFCPKMLGAGLGSEPVAQADSKLACCQRRASSEHPTKKCCAAALANVASTNDAPRRTVAPSSSDGPCGQCKAVPSSPLRITDRVEAPLADWTAGQPTIFADDHAALLALQADRRSLPPSDRLPMTDRVIVLCCLLI